MQNFEDKKLIEVMLDGLGGSDNIVDIDSCITRIRLTVKDVKSINRNLLKISGVKDIVSTTNTELQLIVGIRSKEIVEKLKILIAKSPSFNLEDYVGNILNAIGGKENISFIESEGEIVKVEVKYLDKVNYDYLRVIGLKKVYLNENKVCLIVEDKADIISETMRNISELKIKKYYLHIAKKIFKGLGGKNNVKFIDNCITRLRLEVKDITKVDRNIILSTGAKDIIILNEDSVQIVIGTNVQMIADAMKCL